MSGASIIDLITKWTIFAVLCNDDQHDFFLIKALSGVKVLSRHETDLWGASFPPSALVIRGLYFTKKLNNIWQYKLLKNPPPIVPCESVLYICQESSVKDNLFVLLSLFILAMVLSVLRVFYVNIFVPHVLGELCKINRIILNVWCSIILFISRLFCLKVWFSTVLHCQWIISSTKPLWYSKLIRQIWR
jgi:hypothetical protein